MDKAIEYFRPKVEALVEYIRFLVGNSVSKEQIQVFLAFLLFFLGLVLMYLVFWVGKRIFFFLIQKGIEYSHRNL